MKFIFNVPRKIGIEQTGSQELLNKLNSQCLRAQKFTKLSESHFKFIKFPLNDFDIIYFGDEISKL